MVTLAMAPLLSTVSRRLLVPQRYVDKTGMKRGKLFPKNTNGLRFLRV